MVSATNVDWSQIPAKDIDIDHQPPRSQLGASILTMMGYREQGYTEVQHIAKAQSDALKLPSFGRSGTRRRIVGTGETTQ
jgi:hypothetical protein